MCSVVEVQAGGPTLQQQLHQIALHGAALLHLSAHCVIAASTALDDYALPTVLEGGLVGLILRSEEAPGSVFHPRDKNTKIDCGFLGPFWCNKKFDSER